jgi:hypothetical protein
MSRLRSLALLPLVGPAPANPTMEANGSDLRRPTVPGRTDDSASQFSREIATDLRLLETPLSDRPDWRGPYASQTPRKNG